MLPAIFARTQSLRKLYGGLFTPLLEKWALTQLEADILLFLANNPEYDTARDIVEKRRLAKSHVSVGVEQLVRRGLLGRCFLEGNRKTLHLRLTEAAAPIVAEGRAIQRRYADVLFTGFSAQEKAQLCAMLERIGENVEGYFDSM